MADAVWPISLPTAPLLRGLSERPADLTTRFSTDAGPAKVRARNTVGVRTFPCELLLTGTQVATFDAFFYTTLRGGAEVFEWTHPRTGDDAEFRFVGPPEYVYRAPRQGGTERYTVKFTLELVPSADAIVIGGGGGDPPEGGAFFSTPPGDAGGGSDPAEVFEAWGAAGVFEDPPAVPDGLLWQFGAGDDELGGTGTLDGSAGSVLSGGEPPDLPTFGAQSPQGSGEGGLGSSHDFGGGVISGA